MSSIYYEPKPAKITECVNVDKYNELLQQINYDAWLKPEQKALAKLLATRFLQFKYEKLADYYSVTDAHMQEWLEKLRCVIVDTDSAIKNGYIQYKQNYNKLIEGIVHEK